MIRILSLGFLCLLTARLVCVDSTESESDPKCYEESRLGSAPSSHCRNMFESSCFSALRKCESLTGDEIILSCPHSAPTFSRLRVSCADTSLEVVNGTGYNVNGQTLTIINVSPEDEGVYYCSSTTDITNTQDRITVACLYVSGLASFKTCDPGMLADPMLYPSNSARPRCHQDLNVTEGKVTLDTSLMYMPGGCCGCREYTQRLAIRFDRFDVSIEFNCNEVSIPCLNGEGRKGVVVSRHSDAHFDISLEVEVNLTSSDFKLFYIEIEVSRPGSSTVERFWKVFRVFVNPDISTMPSPVITSSPVTSMIAATSSTTNKMPSPTVVLPITGGLSPSGAVAGGAIGATVVIVLIIVGVVGLTVVLLNRRHRTDSKDLEEKKPQAVFDTVQDIVKLPPTNPQVGGKENRMSVQDFDGSRQLHSHLESKTAVAV